MNSQKDALQVLKETSRTFYIPISLLPNDLKAAVASAYLCMRAIDEIEDHDALDNTTKAQLLRAISLSLQTGTGGHGDRFGADDGWIDTGDNVERVGDRIHFLGRASGVINVGGNKVHPEEVERLLLSHPEIQSARVFSKSSPIMGALVVADIVPSQSPQDPTAFRASIKAHLREQVEPYKIPAILNLVDRLETTATGKLARGLAS